MRALIQGVSFVLQRYNHFYEKKYLAKKLISKFQ